MAAGDAANVVLTNSFWEPIARRIVEHPGFARSDLEVKVVNTGEDDACRKSHRYGLSLLSSSATTRNRPAAFLGETLLAWFDAEHPLAAAALDLRRKEAASGDTDFTALRTALARADGFAVPVVQPPTWSATRVELIGWDGDTQRLDPETLGVRDGPPGDPSLLGVVFLLVGVLGFVSTALVRRERSRQLAQLERDVSAFNHDLSAPIGTIRAEADALRTQLADRADEALRAELLDVAATIEHEALLADALVGDLQVTLTPERVLRADPHPGCHLEAIVDAEVERLRTRLLRTGRPGEVQWRRPEPVGEIALGPTPAQRIVQNLLDNAFKYARPDRPLRVDVLLVEGPRGHAIVVRDWGIGFDPELGKRAFEPRQRGGRAEDQAVAGHGLGLATVAGLVRSVGGTVAISKPVDPTTITVMLPWAKTRRRSG